MTSRPTCNANDYNKALVQSGRIELWLNAASLRHWYHAGACQRRGRPLRYSDAAVQCMLIVRYVYRLPLRQAQGFVQSWFDGMGLSLQAMSYSQLCRRQKTVQWPRGVTGRGRLILAIDGTGLKIYGEGEWKVRQHGYSQRRGWMKLPIGIDVQTQQIVTHHLTDCHSAEHKQLPRLLEHCQAPLARVLADAGYDYHASYRHIIDAGAVPVIAPNLNPRHRLKQAATVRPDKPRDVIRLEQQARGVANWKRYSGYHQRSLVETTMFRFKQRLGDRMVATSRDNQHTEVAFKCHILNTMARLGLPSHV